MQQLLLRKHCRTLIRAAAGSVGVDFLAFLAPLSQQAKQWGRQEKIIRSENS